MHKFYSSLKGDEKELCIKKYYLNGIKDEITKLKEHKKLCNKSKNPNKCIKQLDKYIANAEKNIKLL